MEPNDLALSIITGSIFISGLILNWADTFPANPGVHSLIMIFILFAVTSSSIYLTTLFLTEHELINQQSKKRIARWSIYNGISLPAVSFLSVLYFYNYPGSIQWVFVALIVIISVLSFLILTVGIYSIFLLATKIYTTDSINPQNKIQLLVVTNFLGIIIAPPLMILLF